MLVMEHDIQVGSYKIGTVDSVKIKKSVETLSDTATIVLPCVYVNRALDVENKLKVGDTVTIKLGYLRELQTEFKGYLKAIKTDDGSVTLECEDESYRLHCTLENKEYKSITLKSLLYAILNQVGNFQLECSYDFSYDKYVIKDATAMDVLKKIQDETKASIYCSGNVLYVHPPYLQRSGNIVSYNYAVNIESSNLKYKRKDEKKYQVEVEGVGSNGERVKVTYGPSGGEKRSVKLYGITDKPSLLARAKEQVNLVAYDGYEGSFTGWLIPYCQPSDNVKLIDEENPSRDGIYYVIGVNIEFSSSGGKREVVIGLKVG